MEDCYQMRQCFQLKLYDDESKNQKQAFVQDKSHLESVLGPSNESWFESLTAEQIQSNKNSCQKSRWSVVNSPTASPTISQLIQLSVGASPTSVRHSSPAPHNHAERIVSKFSWDTPQPHSWERPLLDLSPGPSPIVQNKLVLSHTYGSSGLYSLGVDESNLSWTNSLATPPRDTTENSINMSIEVASESTAKTKETARALFSPGNRLDTSVDSVQSLDSTIEEVQSNYDNTTSMQAQSSSKNIKSNINNSQINIEVGKSKVELEDCISHTGSAETNKTAQTQADTKEKLCMKENDKKQTLSRKSCLSNSSKKYRHRNTYSGITCDNSRKGLDSETLENSDNGNPENSLSPTFSQRTKQSKTKRKNIPDLRSKCDRSSIDYILSDFFDPPSASVGRRKPAPARKRKSLELDESLVSDIDSTAESCSNLSVSTQDILTPKGTMRSILASDKKSRNSSNKKVRFSDNVKKCIFIPEQSSSTSRKFERKRLGWKKSSRKGLASGSFQKSYSPETIDLKACESEITCSEHKIKLVNKEQKELSDFKTEDKRPCVFGESNTCKKSLSSHSKITYHNNSTLTSYTSSDNSQTNVSFIVNEGHCKQIKYKNTVMEIEHEVMDSKDTSNNSEEDLFSQVSQSALEEMCYEAEKSGPAEDNTAVTEANGNTDENDNHSKAAKLKRFFYPSVSPVANSYSSRIFQFKDSKVEETGKKKVLVNSVKIEDIVNKEVETFASEERIIEENSEIKAGTLTLPVKEYKIPKHIPSIEMISETADVSITDKDLNEGLCANSIYDANSNSEGVFKSASGKMVKVSEKAVQQASSVFDEEVFFPKLDTNISYKIYLQSLKAESDTKLGSDLSSESKERPGYQIIEKAQPYLDKVLIAESDVDYFKEPVKSTAITNDTSNFCTGFQLASGKTISMPEQAMQKAASLLQEDCVTQTHSKDKESGNQPDGNFESGNEEDVEDVLLKDIEFSEWHEEDFEPDESIKLQMEDVVEVNIDSSKAARIEQRSNAITCNQPISTDLEMIDKDENKACLEKVTLNNKGAETEMKNIADKGCSEMNNLSSVEPSDNNYLECYKSLNDKKMEQCKTSRDEMMKGSLLSVQESEPKGFQTAGGRSFAFDSEKLKIAMSLLNDDKCKENLALNLMGSFSGKKGDICSSPVNVLHTTTDHIQENEQKELSNYSKGKSRYQNNEDAAMSFARHISSPSKGNFAEGTICKANKTGSTLSAGDRLKLEFEQELLNENSDQGIRCFEDELKELEHLKKKTLHDLKEPNVAKIKYTYPKEGSSSANVPQGFRPFKPPNITRKASNFVVSKSPSREHTSKEIVWLPNKQPDTFFSKVNTDSFGVKSNIKTTKQIVYPESKLKHWGSENDTKDNAENMNDKKGKQSNSVKIQEVEKSRKRDHTINIVSKATVTVDLIDNKSLDEKVSMGPSFISAVDLQGMSQMFDDDMEFTHMRPEEMDKPGQVNNSMSDRGINYWTKQMDSKDIEQYRTNYTTDIENAQTTNLPQQNESDKFECKQDIDTLDGKTSSNTISRVGFATASGKAVVVSSTAFKSATSMFSDCKDESNLHNVTHHRTIKNTNHLNVNKVEPTEGEIFATGILDVKAGNDSGIGESGHLMNETLLECSVNSSQRAVEFPEVVSSKYENDVSKPSIKNQSKFTGTHKVDIFEGVESSTSVLELTLHEDEILNKWCETKIKFPGFHTASGNKVEISETEIEHAKQHLSENESLHSFPEKTAKFPGFSTALGNKVEISDTALKHAKQDLSENKSLHSVPEKTAKFQGFSTASGNKVEISDTALKHAKQHLSENESLQSVPEKTAKFPGFSTASGNKVEISDTALKHAKQYLSENESLHSVPEKTAKFPGFSTASGNKVEISDTALKHAKQHLSESESLHSVPEMTAKFPGFSTASGNKVGISDTALKHDKQHLSENESLHSVPEKTAKFPGFSTASGNKVEISDTALKHAKQHLSENESLHSVPEKTAKFPGFSTASGNKVEISDTALKHAKQHLSENESLHSVPEKTAKFSGFSTASGNKVEISDTALKHAKQHLTENESLHSNSEKTAKFPGFSTASGNKVEISDTALKHAKRHLSENESLHSVPEKTAKFPGFSTASGNKVEISDTALKHAKQHLSENESLHSVSEKTAKFSGFSTASGNKVEISDTALKHAKQHLSENESLHSVPEKTAKFPGFSTASGNKVEISDTALKHAKQHLSENESLHSVPEKTAKFPGFSTASGNKVEISDTALKHAKQHLSENESLHSVPEKTAKFPGFSTASGNKVEIPDTALKHAKQHLSENESSSSDPEEGMDFPGFSTASGNKVEISDMALKHVKHLSENEIIQKTGICPFEGSSLTRGNKFEASMAIQVFSDDSSKNHCNSGVHTAGNVPLQQIYESEETDLEDMFGMALKRRKLDMNREKKKLKSLEDEETSYRRKVVQSGLKTETDQRHPGFRPFKPVYCKPKQSERSVVERSAPTEPDHSTPLPLQPPYNTISLLTKREVSKHVSLNIQEQMLGPKLGQGDVGKSNLDRSGVNDMLPSGDNIHNIALDKNRDSKMETSSIDIALMEDMNTGTSSNCLKENSSVQMKFVSNLSSGETKSDRKTGEYLMEVDSIVSECSVSNVNDLKHDDTYIDSDEPAQVPDKDGKKMAQVSENVDFDSFSQDEDDLYYCMLVEAQRFQDGLIKQKAAEQVKPKPGKLWTMKQAGIRLKLKDIIDNLGQEPYRKDIHMTAESAVNYQFSLETQYSKSTAHVMVGDGAYLVPDDLGRIGKQEMYRAFLTVEGVDGKLISEAWVNNHYRWIIWKLAAYEKTSTLLKNRCLTTDMVMYQLKYRYDREIDLSQRSAVKKIFEKDDTPSKRLVLCVAAVKTNNSSKLDASNHILLELTDGWYSIPAMIDNPLRQLVAKGKIKIGDKLCMTGAELVGAEDACTPLEAPSSVMLKICRNSTRSAPWDCILGYQSDPRPLCIPLIDLHSEGGVVGVVDVVIVRKYPTMYMEKFEGGGCIFRTRRCEDKALQEYESKKQTEMEKLYRQIEDTAEKEHTQERKVRRIRKYRRTDVENLQTGQEIYEAMDQAAQPDTVQNYLSDHQLGMMYEYQRQIQEEKQMDFNAKFQRAWQEKLEVFPERNVTPVLKFRIAGCSNRDLDDNTSTVLTIWRPAPEISDIQEGHRYKIYSLNASVSRSKYTAHTVQLTATKQTRFRCMQLDENILDTIYEPREVLWVSDIKRRQPPYGEFDFVGIIVRLAKVTYSERLCSTVYLADCQGGILAVRFWNGLNSFGSAMFEEGNTLCFSNLMDKHSYRNTHIPAVDVTTEFTHITNKSQNTQQRKALDKLLTVTAKDKVAAFLKKANFMIDQFQTDTINMNIPKKILDINIDFIDQFPKRNLRRQSSDAYTTGSHNGNQTTSSEYSSPLVTDLEDINTQMFENSQFDEDVLDSIDNMSERMTGKTDKISEENDVKSGDEYSITCGDIKEETAVKIDDTIVEKTMKKSDSEENVLKSDDSEEKHMEIDDCEGKPIKGCESEGKPMKSCESEGKPMKSGESEGKPMKSGESEGKPMKSGESEGKPMKSGESEGKPMKSGESEGKPIKSCESEGKPIKSGDSEGKPMKSGDSEGKPMKSGDSEENVVKNCHRKVMKRHSIEEVLSSPNSDNMVKENITSKSDSIVNKSAEKNVFRSDKSETSVVELTLTPGKMSTPVIERKRVIAQTKMSKLMMYGSPSELSPLGTTVPRSVSKGFKPPAFKKL